MSITYTAALPVRDETVVRISALLHAEHPRRYSPRRAASVLRWLLDGTGVSQLARDNTISLSTGCERLPEAIAVLAAQALGLHSALLAAKAAGYDDVPARRQGDRDRLDLDTQPTAVVDLWWSANCTRTTAGTSRC